jgi:hypothetical protein
VPVSPLQAKVTRPPRPSPFRGAAKRHVGWVGPVAGPPACRINEAAGRWPVRFGRRPLRFPSALVGELQREHLAAGRRRDVVRLGQPVKHRPQTVGGGVAQQHLRVPRLQRAHPELKLA